MYYTNEHARSYAACRRICSQILESLIDEGGVGRESRVIEAGCGSGNYLWALKEATGCSAAGFDPSEGMLSEARAKGEGLVLRQGRAEEIARLHPPASAALIYSVDVIHHVGDVPAYFGGAREVLSPRGRIGTVTDSEEIIRHRRPLSEYWPETVAQELRRYPPMERLQDWLERAGFADLFVLTVFREYRLTSAESYRRKVFSSLNLIAPEDFERGLARLQADLVRGSIIANTSYVLIWGTRK